MEVKIDDVLNVYDSKMGLLIRENAILIAEKYELLAQIKVLQKEVEDATKRISGQTEE